MGSQNSRKVNPLLKQWPKGTVATKSQLDKFGIYRQLAAKYLRYDWIQRIGTGAFIRSGDTVDWQGGLYALQTQLGMSVHVAGRTALELQGQALFVPLGPQKRVILISDQLERLPTWFRNYRWEARLEHHCLSLFDRVPEAATTKLDCGGFEIVLSSTERAVLEQMHLAKSNDEIEHVHQLMEGLSTLRPTVVQELLENCRSAKVKRLFLWSAETVGHSWFGRLGTSRVDLGKGKRQLYEGGQLDQKYRITVPRRGEPPSV